MKETLKLSTSQGWTKTKLVGTLVLLAAAVGATLFLPIEFLDWATEAIGRDDGKSAFWKEWSFGLVVLGPSLFTASFLAMASQQPKGARWMVRGFSFALTLGIYWRLFEIEELRTSILVGSVGVVYSLLADGFTPSSSGSAATDNEAPESGESTKAVAEPDKPTATADSVSLKPRSEAPRVDSPLTLLLLLIAPVVALVLDVRDLGIRHWSGTPTKSRR